MKQLTILLLASALVLFIGSCKKDNDDNTDTNGDVGNHSATLVTNDSVITTIAGKGTFGFSGDGGAATAAEFGVSSPTRVTLDKGGNIYLADVSNKRIRMVNAAGIITTIAGTGTGGFSGDNGAATSAKIQSPQGMCVDTSGNLYFADANNGRIRKITTGGIISTVAGGGPYSPTDGVGGPAVNATLHLPNDVTLDPSGNLIIADYGNHRIKKVDKTTGIITTLAGNGTQGYTGDGGQATSAGLQYPKAVTFDASGNLYVTTNNRIRKITPGGVISTVAGTGNMSFNFYNGPGITVNINPAGLAFNNIGELIIADYGQSLVRKLDASGNISTIAGYGGYNNLFDGGRPYLAGFNYPSGVAVDTAGNIYIADYGAKRVRKIILQ